MRKIEREMLRAIDNRQSFHKDNTAVVWYSADEGAVSLHGNIIAFIESGGRLILNRIMLAQWPTRTTMSRLNAMGFHVGTHRGKIYIDGKEMDNG